MSERDDYLWDPNGTPPDAEIAEFERLLGRFAHDARPLAEPASARRRPAPWWWLAAAAAVVVSAILWFVIADSTKAKKPVLELTLGGEALAEKAWVTAGDRPRLLTLGRLADDDVGRFALTPGSRLQVRRVDEEQTMLYLERGELHAFVTPNAEPRFFQVGTPSGVCVDLGCEYDLAVDDDGETHVRVTLGQIAFELDGEDVFVPRGAECRAGARGAGLPHFSDCSPMIRGAAEKYRATRDPANRLGIAEFLCQVIERKRDSLTLWHLLRLEEPEVQAVVERKLLDLVGHPDVDAKDPRAMKGAPRLDADAWRRHLEAYWW